MEVGDKYKIIPWEEAAVQEGELLGYLTNDGWLVARAIMVEDVPYDYADDEVTRYPSIAAGQVSGPVTPGPIPGRFMNADGLSTIYHENEDEIWQCFFGVSWPLTRVFLDYPYQSRHGQLRDDIGGPAVQNTGASSWGWKFYGWQSRYGKETSISQFLLPYMVEIGVAIHNLASQAKAPFVSFHLNKVKYDPLDPSNEKDAQLIVDVLKRRITKGVRVLWSPSVDGFNFKPGFRKIFTVDPVKLEGREVYRIPLRGGPVSLLTGKEKTEESEGGA